MRILLNAAPLVTVLTGVQRYTRALYTTVLEQELADVRFYCNGHVTDAMPIQPEGAPRRLVPPTLRYWLREAKLKYEDWYVERYLARGTVDVYHETGHFPLGVHSDVPVTMTIYDLSPITCAQHHPPDRVRYFERHFFRRLDHVSRIITISEFVRREIMQVLSVPGPRIAVVPLAPEAVFSARDPARVRDYLERNALPARYILTVGAQEPRKNLVNLLAAMRAMDEPLSLVCAGWKGWLNTEFEEALRNSGMQDRVIRLGHIPDDELALLYSGALALAYPSYYEGYGLPIVEAMACGCPVVCSDRASMPEVAGPAALLVDPEDPDDIAAKLNEITANRVLREQLIQLGHERVRGLSWHHTARRTMDEMSAVIPPRQQVAPLAHLRPVQSSAVRKP